MVSDLAKMMQLMTVRADYSQISPVIIPSIMVDMMHFKNFWVGRISAHTARVHPSSSFKLSSNVIRIGSIARTRIIPDGVASSRAKFFTMCSRWRSPKLFLTGATLNYNTPLSPEAFIVTFPRAILRHIDSVVRHLEMCSANKTRPCSLNQT